MFLRVAVIVILLVCNVNTQEPQCVCSKYHYEEQLLEKSIRTEIKFEELQRTVQTLLTEANEKYNELTSEMKQWKEDSERDRAESLASIVEEKTRINDTLVKIDQLAKQAVTPDILFQATTPSTMTPGVNTIIFTVTSYNYGGGYDNQTGVFTAPVSGTYLFTGHLCNYHTKSVYYGIVVDGIDVTRGHSYDHYSYSCFSFTAVKHVDKSSSVVIKSFNGASHIYQDVNRINTFSGVLLH